MAYGLTSDQVHRVVNNTLLVLLSRPDLMSEWHTNLLNLLTQTRSADLEDEAIFVAAVVTLLASPDDTLPTGTVYDTAWQSLVSGLRTGVAQPAATEGDSMSLDRLLGSIAEAVIAVMLQMPEQRDFIAHELRQMRAASTQGGMEEFQAWLDDTLALMAGTPPSALGRRHQGVYGAYWDAILERAGADGAPQ
jgi:hypothetical protein